VAEDLAPPITVDDVVEHIDEIILGRRAEYPRMVQRNLITKDEAFRRIALLEQARIFLMRLKEVEKIGRKILDEAGDYTPPGRDIP
jgi:hypothetical protein